MEVMICSAPKPDQVEVTLLGPGYGECCVIHVGNNKWIVIDSCRGSSDAPAAVDYLESLGIEPKEAVDWIIVTHWHDDHIYGLAELAKRCEHAEICMSGALRSNEFVARVAPYSANATLAGGSGLKELFQLSICLSRADRSITNGYQDRRLSVIEGSEFQHGRKCEVWTLSPSDAQIELFFKDISQLTPLLWQTKRRLPSRNPNHLSVVTLVLIGELGILLGGDLEEIGTT